MNVDDDELRRRLAQLAAHARATPRRALSSDERSHRTRLRRGARPWRAVLAVGLAAAVVVGLVVVSHRNTSSTPVGVPDGPSVPSPSPSSEVVAPTTVPVPPSIETVPPSTVAAPTAIAVHHSRISVTLDGQLTCADPIDTTGAAPTMIIGAYSDRTGRRWRNHVTYPDGTSRDVIVSGSAIYPTAIWERGEAKGSRIGCNAPGGGEPFVLVAEPGQGSFYTLTKIDEVTPEERPYLLEFDLAKRLDGDHTDDLGRASQQWEERVTGFAGYDNAATLPVVQVTDWYIDPANSTTVTEHRYVNSIDQMGTATETEVLTLDESTTVPGDFFDPAGYRSLPTYERPSLEPQIQGTAPSPVP